MRLYSSVLLLLLLITLGGAGQVLPQGEVGDGGWELERVIGRGTAEDLAVSPDGNTLAVAGSQGLWIYSLPTLELLRHIDAGNWLFDVEWSPDSGFVAAAGRNSQGLYRLASGEYLAEEPGAATQDHSIRVWDARSGAFVRTLPDSNFTARLAWSPTGDMLAAVSHDGFLRTWDVQGGGAHTLARSHPHFIFNFAWSPDGHEIASSTPFALLVIDVNTGEEEFYGDGGSIGPLPRSEVERVMDLMPGDVSPAPVWWHTSGEFILARHRQALWSPDGTKLAGTTDAGAFGDFLAVFEPPVADELFRQTIDSIENLSTAPVWSPDGLRIAYETGDGAFIRDATSGELLLRLRHYEDNDLDQFARQDGLTGLAWSRDGKRIASAGRDNRIMVHDASQGGTLAVMTQDSAVHDLAWPQDREFLVSSTTRGDIQVWDARDGQQLAITGEHGRRTADYLLRHSSWGPAGQGLYAGGRYVDVSTGQDIPAANWPYGVIPSPDHRLLIADPNDALRNHSPLVIRHAGTLEPWQEIEALEVPFYVYSVVWSPDGNRFALGSSHLSGHIHHTLYRTDAGLVRTAHFIVKDSENERWTPHPTTAWSPDGLMVATNPDCSGSGCFSILQVRMADGGHPVTVIPLHAPRMFSLAWSGDGRLLAGGGEDSSLAVWDMEFPAATPPLAAFAGTVLEGQVVHALAWSPDGSFLAAGTAAIDDRQQPGIVALYAWKDGALDGEVHLTGHSAGIASLAWSPDGSRLASTDLGGVVHVWRAPQDG